jgi:methionyl aminopeptidase
MPESYLWRLPLNRGEKASELFNPFPAFPFTGSVRPVYPLSARRQVPESIPHPDYAKDGIPKSERKFVGRKNITILDKSQQDAMRKVCRLTREVLDIAAREIRPGVTTDYLDEIVHKACLEREVGSILAEKRLYMSLCVNPL